MTPERASVPPCPDQRPGTSGTTSPSGFVARLLELGRCRRDLPAPPPAPPPPDTAASLAPGGPSLAEINPPPLPQAFCALRRTAENPTSTISDVAAVISMDPSLATYVLRLANSPLYASQVRVETVSRAVGLIGLDEISTLATAAMMTRLFDSPPRPELVSMPDFWRHAVAVGMLTRSLAGRRGELALEQYFVAGLLHDMGRLLLAVAEPGMAAASLARAVHGRLPLDAAERLELAFDHAVLGGRICVKWRLPDLLSEAVGGHHAPSACPENILAAAVHAADFIANALGVRAAPHAALPYLEEDVLALFNLSGSDPEALCAVLDEGLSAMTALFDPRPFSDALLPSRRPGVTEGKKGGQP